LHGNESALQILTSSPLVVARNNFVERPWGGTRIRDYKRLHPLPEQAAVSGLGLGEAFELSAFDGDDEASRFPSFVVCSDGSRLSLPQLLAQHGRRILGDSFVDTYGACLPLLPKTLDIKELLSVQGHPAGHTEVYIIIDAEPGATLGLGFKNDMDAAALETLLISGLRRQRELMDILVPGSDQLIFQQRAAPWFAKRESASATIDPWIGEFVASANRPSAAMLLQQLKGCYWQLLDSMNAIEAAPGRVIYNATPRRLLGEGAVASAEVHALGNPQGLEVIALEVRLPGPTYRAWDNVRFPQRPVDVPAAIAALNLRATSPDEFICRETPDPARPGVTCSVDCEFFRIEHFRPHKETTCGLNGSEPSCLHVLAGEVVVSGNDRREPAILGRGDAALVPIGLNGCVLSSDAGAHVVSVTLPCSP
jgi:mannose-6-phosphate isomerase class I